MNNCPALDEDIALQLDQRLCPAQPGEAAVVQRVRERVMGSIGREPGPRHRTVRAGEAGWEQLGPGLERKLLWESGDAVSCLMRLAPGTRVEGHAHPIDEECVVLQGSLRIGSGLVLLPGDFHVGVKGVQHEVASTETGALVYLRGARQQAAPSA